MNEQVQTIKNPLIERARLPGKIHALPSRGLFYKDGELDPSVERGELHVHPMTTYEELVLKSPDLLFSGDAVKIVLERCVPQVVKPTKLLAKDVDFLMLVLRHVSYGNEFEVKYTHTCKKAQPHSYVIPLDDIIQRTKAIDPTSFTKLFSVKLPNDQVVKLSPIRYEGMIRLLQTTDTNLDANKRRDMLTEILLDWLDSVDGITDKAMIKEWLNTIPAGYARLIESSIDNSQNKWGMDITVKIKCKDCKELTDVSAPINPLTFFT